VSGDDGDHVYLAPGDVVANKYRVDRVLGVGGVGFVVAATHVEIGGLFALKFLQRQFVGDKTICERFTREARAACRISSKYVARVYDVGLHDGAPFIVLEHLVGRDLSSILADRRALGLDESVEYGLQACAALAVAHANGIVHRDIKPENLFVVDELGVPTVKLLDFGISKFILASGRIDSAGTWEEEPITGTLICGTPDYMSPEQIRSTLSVDARSDVWSLGIVLYELIASTPPFRADSVADTCAAILEIEPRRLDAVRPEVPSGFADVVARCLEKDRANRFATVAELAIALLPFAPARALAIAENSEWIRRAAIQTIGASTDTPLSSRSAPISSGRGPISTPSSTRSQPVSSTSWPISSRSAFVSSGRQPNLPPPGVSEVTLSTALPTPRRRWLGAATAVAMSIAAISVYVWIGGGNRAAEGRGSTPRISPASPLSLPELVPTAAAVVQPSVSRGASPEAVPVESSAASIHAVMPSAPRALSTWVRAPASLKAVPASSSAGASAATTPASLPLPSSPWQTVTAPPARTARAIDSSNPWSTTNK
jgi:eukaryotic-like serine/threonine-protein kinase